MTLNESRGVQTKAYGPTVARQMILGGPQLVFYSGLPHDGSTSALKRSSDIEKTFDTPKFKYVLKSALSVSLAVHLMNYYFYYFMLME